MVTLKAHFDGKVIVPDEPTGLAAGTLLRVTLEPMDKPVSSPAVGRLDLPLLTGIDPETVLAIMDASEIRHRKRQDRSIFASHHL